MGLAAHGLKKNAPQWTTPPKTTQDIALQLITLQALRGPNPLLQSAL
jgi:hypothetical protein